MDTELNIRAIQDKIREGGPILDYEKDDIEYIERPIGKAIFNKADTPKKIPKVDPMDLIECEYCKCWITRRNLYVHKKTKKHQVQLNINSKLRELLID